MAKRGFELLRWLGSMGNLSYMVVTLFWMTYSAALLCECNERSRHIVNSFEVVDKGPTCRAFVHEVRQGGHSNDLANDLHPVTLRFVTVCLISPCCSHQIRLLLSQMNQAVVFTAWRFYKLDRASILQTFGACITYVSLFVQGANDVL